MAPPPIPLVPIDMTVTDPRFLFGVMFFQPDLVEHTPGAVVINVIDRKWPVPEESGFIVELPPEVGGELAKFVLRPLPKIEVPAVKEDAEDLPETLLEDTGAEVDRFHWESPAQASEMIRDNTLIEPLTETSYAEFQAGHEKLLMDSLDASAVLRWPVTQVTWGDRAVRINPENGNVEASRRGVPTDFDAATSDPNDLQSPVGIYYNHDLLGDRDPLSYPAVGAVHLCVVGDALVVKNKDGKWWTMTDYTDRMPLMAMPAPNTSEVFYRTYQGMLLIDPKTMCPICGKTNEDHEIKTGLYNHPALWCDVGNIKACVSASTPPESPSAAESLSSMIQAPSAITPSDSTSPSESKAPETTTPA